MKTSFRISSIIAIILLLSSCLSSKKLVEPNTVILPLSDTISMREGSIVYGLPKSVFTVFVTMERTIEKPGPYARFAGDLLGLDNVIMNENESWSIASVNIKSHDELDPSEYYVIKSNTNFQTNVLTLKKEGLILDLNPAVFYNSENIKAGTVSDINNLLFNDLGSDEYYQVQRDTAYKRVAVDSTFIRIPYAVEKKKKLTIDQLAEKAAKRVMDLRDGKLLILTGEATVFPQNEAPINEINRLEKAYTELFTGKTFTETRTFSYQIDPLKNMVGKPVTLFKFSELTGPLDSKAAGGKPVVVELTPELKTKGISILFKKQIEPETPKFDKLYYRVPDVVNMKISIGAEVLINSRKLIYQFGEVIQLPSNYIIGR
jgi:hypothetical protein